MRIVAGRDGLAILAVLVVSACAAGATNAPAPPAPAGGAVIVAAGIRFDRNELTVPAGRAFPLLFENRDGAPHNVRILANGSDATVFEGETFSGPAERTYDVPSLSAGRYRFRCDVHPEMSGDVIAG
jgi:plastocyanin